jgi:hypothetical protein
MRVNISHVDILYQIAADCQHLLYNGADFSTLYAYPVTLPCANSSSLPHFRFRLWGLVVAFSLTVQLALPFFQSSTVYAHGAVRRDRRPDREVTVRVRSISNLSSISTRAKSTSATLSDDQKDNEDTSSRRSRRGD